MDNFDFSAQQTLNPKVIIVFFVKNFLGTLYIIPIWWIAVSIFEQVGSRYLTYLPKEQIILLLDSAGAVYLILLLIYSYYWAWLTYSHFSYALQSDGLHIYHGVILKKDTLIPYNYIQDVQVYVNPFIAKFLQLYSLSIRTKNVENTAGILHHTRQEHIPGLSADILANLKSQLIASTHILAVKPRSYFDPKTGVYH